MKPLHALPFALFATTTTAQNLVPNGSFEEYTECPDFMFQIDYAVGWQAFRLSPDYMNACDLSDTVSVPRNLFGFQHAVDGVAYSGIINYNSSSPDQREFLGIQLTQPLITGVPVYISFKVALGAYGQPNYRMRWSTNNVGLRFTMNSFFQLSGPLPNSSAIHLDPVLSDTTAWQTVSGIYIPDSAYVYVVLGNFYDDTLTQVIEIDPSAVFTPQAYTYVDDVCVSYDPAACDLGSGAHQVQNIPGLLVWPNPFVDAFHIEAVNSNELIGAELLTITGQLCHHWNSSELVGPVQLTAPELPCGAYILHVATRTGGVRPFILLHASP